uniref:Uncharacterized protein n=2 Tax=Cacopsylla melanoneura TaxID=428564 RepID=A0A8D8R5B0_9HEMI
MIHQDKDKIRQKFKTLQDENEDLKATVNYLRKTIDSLKFPNGSYMIYHHPEEDDISYFENSMQLIQNSRHSRYHQRSFAQELEDEHKNRALDAPNKNGTAQLNRTVVITLEDDKVQENNETPEDKEREETRESVVINSDQVNEKPDTSEKELTYLKKTPTLDRDKTQQKTITNKNSGKHNNTTEGQQRSNKEKSKTTADSNRMKIIEEEIINIKENLKEINEVIKKTDKQPISKDVQIIMEEHHKEKRKQIIHLIGDSHIRYLAKEVELYIGKDYEIKENFRPGINFKRTSEQLLPENINENDILVLSSGTNDLYKTEWSTIEQSIATILEQKCRVIPILIPPQNSHQNTNKDILKLNTLLKHEYRKHGLSEFIEPQKFIKPWHIAHDGVHLGRKGKIWLSKKIIEKVRGDKEDEIEQMNSNNIIETSTSTNQRKQRDQYECEQNGIWENGVLIAHEPSLVQHMTESDKTNHVNKKWKKSSSKTNPTQKQGETNNTNNWRIENEERGLWENGVFFPRYERNKINHHDGNYNQYYEEKGRNREIYPNPNNQINFQRKFQGVVQRQQPTQNQTHHQISQQNLKPHYQHYGLQHQQKQGQLSHNHQETYVGVDNTIQNTMCPNCKNVNNTNDLKTSSRKRNSNFREGFRLPYQL